MPTMTFYARGDSATANNASVNVQGTSTTPTTALTFTSGTNGDIKLDYNGGAADPDTQVIINGVTMNFTVQLSGTIPNANKYSNVAGVDMRGKQIVVITAANGHRYVFATDGSGTQAVMQALPNGAMAIRNFSQSGPVLICFLAGTRIATPRGERTVETLRVGDLVLTRDHGPQPLRWIGRRLVTPVELLLYPQLLPVCLRAGSIAPGLPVTDLWVSPQHRIVVEGWLTQLHFGLDQALAPAHLFGPRQRPDGELTYFHLMFDAHEILWSNGLPAESFQPGERGLSTLDAEALAEFDLLFPRFTRPEARPDALPALRGREAALLAACL